VKYLISIAFLVVGIILGLVIPEIIKINFSKGISPGELIDIFLTLFVAIIIPIYIKSNLQNRRIEKDILIEQAKEVRNYLDQIREIVTDCYHGNSIQLENQKSINKLIRKLSNSINSLNDELCYCKMKLDKCSNDCFFQTFVEYKKTVTGQNYGSPKYAYSDKTYKDQEQIHDKFKKLINRLIIQINRH
jgi:hypothetical protein